jgi:hypothetical protein
LPTSCKEEEEIDKTLYHAPFDALFNISEVIFVNDLHNHPPHPPPPRNELSLKCYSNHIFIKEGRK